MKRITAVILMCLVAVIVAGPLAWAGIIDPELNKILQHLGPDEEISFIVSLTDQVDLKYFKDKDIKLRRYKILKALKNKAEKSQKDIKKFLKQNKAKKIKSFWIFNGFSVTASVKLIHKLAALEGIESIRLNTEVKMPELQAAVSSNPPAWNIDMVRAPEIWNLGYDGTGIVVASMDTGVDATHPDLGSRWRGGSNSWYDPHGQHVITPYDYSGHGTGVMGIMVGGDAGGTAIGVTPGAQWIAVKIFNDSGLSNIGTIHAGFEWLLDPDENAETDDAPDIVNNSWGFPDTIDPCFDEFLPDIQTLKAVEIGVVFSAGNGGPYAPSDESPANNQESFGVGAVDSTQTITHFSARGPSSCDGTIFPEVVAPGFDIWTADKGGFYTFGTGTSFAAPHVTGSMALLLSAFPSLSISEIEDAITTSAMDLGNTGPDNTYGHGLLDVMAAYNLLGQNYSLPPFASNDIVAIPRNSTAQINILVNDSDPDGVIDAASVFFRSGTSADSTVRGGTVVANSDGTVTYTPEGGGGPDYFWYRVKDNFGVTSNEAEVRINRVRAGTSESTVVPNSYRGRTR